MTQLNPELSADTVLPLFMDIWEKGALPTDWTLGTSLQSQRKDIWQTATTGGVLYSLNTK